MVRAPHPGAPQRVSAHVVPKAPTFSPAAPAQDEDEKTTIESGGWEEEASTTVEQGEVADKLRALGIGAEPPRRSNTSITSTDGSGVSDEPTVDDQRASAAIALLPPPSVARLVVTGGNDSGHALEIRPGKTYTIGRGIDNDLVLTDITASRKHFDLRNENGSWILADRGSGNGTLVNNRIEDAPFMLASGDTIEVGNTAFRFDVVSAASSLPGPPREPSAPASRREPPPGGPDLRERPAPAIAPERAVSRELVAPAIPHGDAAPALLRDGQDPRALADGIPRQAPSIPTYDGSVDDELEPSTMSGKPFLEAAPPNPAAAPGRPKTLPPPAPRPRTQTGRPPLGYGLDRAGPPSQSMAVPSPQPPGLASAIAVARPPTLSPLHAPALLPQPATTMPLPQLANRPPMSPALLDPSAGPLPATLPGQGPPLPPRGPRLPFSYPNVADMVSQYAPSHVRGPVHMPAGHPGRDATSTALVPPMSYSGSQAAIDPHPHRVAPRISRRVAIVLGGTGLVAIAAIAAMVIIRSGVEGVGAAREPGVDPAVLPVAPDHEPVVAPEDTLPPAEPPGRPATSPTPSSASRAAIPPRTGRADGSTSPPAPATPASPGAARIASPAAPTGPPAPGASTPTARSTSTGPIAPPAAPTSPASPGAATSSAPPADPGAPARTTQIASASSPATPAPRATAPSTPSRAEVAAAAARDDSTAAARDDSRPAARDDSRADRKPAKRIDTRRPDRKAEVDPPAARSDRNDRSEKKRGGRSLQDLKAEASARYRSKDFSGAAALLTASLAGYGSDDVKELKSLAAIYNQLGRAYNVGMAPGTRPTEAYQALRRALDYDREVGKAHVSEMQAKLADTAARAATSYMAIKEYELAYQAVHMAEALGSASASNKAVRSVLENTAADLYREASSERASNPDDARKKLRQIQGIVDTGNPLRARAQKLLNEL